MSTKLYVGNLPYETTETDLQALFEGRRPGGVGERDARSRHGPGPRLRVRGDEQPGRGDLCHQPAGPAPFGGRNLTVNLAKPMAARSGGGGVRRRPADGIALVSRKAPSR